MVDVAVAGRAFFILSITWLWFTVWRIEFVRISNSSFHLLGLVWLPIGESKIGQ